MAKAPKWIVGIAAAALSFQGCAAGAAGDIFAMQPPSGLIEDMGAATQSAEAAVLRTEVLRFSRGQYTIEKARYFKIKKFIDWSQVSLETANERGAMKGGRTGGPNLKRPSWYRAGFDLIDIYPESRKSGTFAVAMAKEPLPDGNKLVGYFSLKAVAK